MLFLILAHALVDRAIIFNQLITVCDDEIWTTLRSCDQGHMIFEKFTQRLDSFMLMVDIVRDYFNATHTRNLGKVAHKPIHDFDFHFGLTL